jgi:hypothetical protein
MYSLQEEIPEVIVIPSSLIIIKVTVGTLKLGYPLLLYKDVVPMWLSLVAW